MLVPSLQIGKSINLILFLSIIHKKNNFHFLFIKRQCFYVSYLAKLDFHNFSSLDTSWIHISELVKFLRAQLSISDSDTQWPTENAIAGNMMTAIKNIIIQTKKIIHNNTQKIKTKTQKLKKSMINNSHKFRHSHHQSWSNKRTW